MIRAQVVLVFAAVVLLNNVQERAFRKKNLEIEGRLPLPPAQFKLGKLALIAAWAAGVLQALGVPVRSFPVSGVIEAAALAGYYAGFALLVLAYLGLGEANKIGLPRENTRLKTEGVYRRGRNPLYTGLFLMDLASCAYAANPIVWLLAVVALFSYHRIVLAEEAFLLERFGTEYAVYRGRVRRYFLV